MLQFYFNYIFQNIELTWISAAPEYKAQTPSLVSWALLWSYGILFLSSVALQLRLEAKVYKRNQCARHG